MPPPEVGGYLAAAWNAFVLQTLGAGLTPTTPPPSAIVPPVTFDQARSWFVAAAEWRSQAGPARANPDYNLAAELRLLPHAPAYRP
jgi:hypothetical protein